MAYRSAAATTAAPAGGGSGVTAKDVRLTLGLMALCWVVGIPVGVAMHQDDRATLVYPARTVPPDAGPDAPPAVTDAGR